MLVEDEPDLGAAIKRSLNHEAYIVDWVQNGTEAEWYLESKGNEYSIAIFDWLLPGKSGLELCKWLRSQQSSLPVLMLTAKDRMEDTVTGLDAGADDYMTKPFGTAELLARLRSLSRRIPQFQPQRLQVNGYTLDFGTHTISFQKSPEETRIIELTNKELVLLEYFMRHPNQILTRDQMLDRLWEVGAEPNSNVVAAHMRRLRRKLADHGCEPSIETVYGIGYRFNTTDEPK